jgi:hypothetical protein
MNDLATRRGMSDLLAPDDTRDALRNLGGLLLGIGFLLWVFRVNDGLSDFVLFLLLAAPAAFLYGLGVFTLRETRGLRAWQTVYTGFGLLLVPLALFAFVNLVDGEPSDLNTFWIFGLTAALGAYAGIVAGVRWALLLGGVALIISWSGLWDKILGDEGLAGNFGIYRGLLGILSILLLAAALFLWRENPGEERTAATATDVTGDRGLWKGSELFTAAGIAAVLGCSLGVASFVNEAGTLPVEINVPATSLFWDALLLVISLGLIAVGSYIGVRGPVYVGAIGLVLFLILVGADLDDDSESFSEQKIGIWPIVVLVLGALAVGLSFVREASQGDRPARLVRRLRGSTRGPATGRGPASGE